MDLGTWIRLVAGVVTLVVAAEILVRGASRLASSVGISPLVVGLTVVAFGTSAPELAVTVRSSLAGTDGVGLGNVVGSNVFNVLVVLGLSALLSPLAVDRAVVRREVPLVIGLSVLVLVLALDGSVGRLEGGLMFLGLIGYTVWTVRQSRREVRESMVGDPPPRPATGQLLADVAMVIGGLVGLTIGAGWLVAAAVTMATAFGVSELVVGLTVVAAGTSLPELATSVVAAIRGQRDLAVGNVLGSNVFNILSVLGLSAAVSSDGIEVPLGALTFDLPVMIAVAVACLPVFLANYCIERWQGAVLLGWYLAYVVYLVLDATAHHALDELEAGLFWFVLPITALTLAVVMVRGLRRRRS